MQLAWLGRGTGTSPFSRQGSRGLEMGSNLWFTLEELDRLQPRAPVTRQPLLRAASCDFRGWRVGLPFPPIPRPWGKFSQADLSPPPRPPLPPSAPPAGSPRVMPRGLPTGSRLVSLPLRCFFSFLCLSAPVSLALSLSVHLCLCLSFWPIVFRRDLLRGPQGSRVGWGSR